MKHRCDVWHFAYPRLLDLGTLDSGRAINADDQYACKVDSVVLFGSMLSEKFDNDTSGPISLLDDAGERIPLLQVVNGKLVNAEYTKPKDAAGGPAE